MRRYFFDCDDTLVLYQNPGSNPYGAYMGTPYIINIGLLAGIRNIRNHDPDALIVVWSGGGKEYAEMWIDRLGLGGIAVGMIKDRSTFSLVRLGDVVVDDDPLGGLTTFDPMEWPEELCECGNCIVDARDMEFPDELPSAHELNRRPMCDCPSCRTQNDD